MKCFRDSISWPNRAPLSICVVILSLTISTLVHKYRERVWWFLSDPGVSLPEIPKYFSLLSGNTTLDMHQYWWQHSFKQEIRNVDISEQDNVCTVITVSHIFGLDLSNGEILWSQKLANIITDELHNQSPREKELMAVQAEIYETRALIAKIHRLWAETALEAREKAHLEEEKNMLTAELNWLQEREYDIPPYHIPTSLRVWHIRFPYFEPPINIFFDPKTGKQICRLYSEIDRSRSVRGSIVCYGNWVISETTQKRDQIPETTPREQYTFTFRDGGIQFHSGNPALNVFRKRLQQYDIYHFNRFAWGESIQHVLRTREALEKGKKEYFQGKPLCVIMTAEDQEMDLALRRDVTSDIIDCNGGNVAYFEVRNEQDFLQYMKMLEQLGQPVELFINYGHGYPNTFSFNLTDYSDGAVFDNRDTDMCHTWSCLWWTQIIYMSCYTGSPQRWHQGHNVIELTWGTYGRNASRITGATNMTDDAILHRSLTGKWWVDYYRKGMSIPQNSVWGEDAP